MVQGIMSQNRFTSGVKEPSKEQLARIPMLRIKPKGITRTPVRWDLSDHLPIPKNQGDQGSCAAWTLGFGLKSYHERIEEGNYNLEFSPSYIYNQVLGCDLYCFKINNDDCGDGIYINCGLKFLKDFGCAQLKDFPYSGDSNDCYKTPSYNLIEDSKKYRILSFDKIHDSFNYFEEIDPDQFKEYIASGIPVVVGMYLDSAFWENRYGYSDEDPFIWDTYLGNCRKCYHAMLCVGYDDHLNAFKFMNSYGVDFGNDGFGWIDYEVAKRAIQEAYITTDANNNDQYFVSNKSLLPHKQEKEYIKNNSAFLYETWLKSGYYRDLYNGIRISVIHINKKDKAATFRFYDTNADTNIELSTYLIKKGETFSFEYNKTKYNITLNKIGYNIFQPAAYYALSIH